MEDSGEYARQEKRGGWSVDDNASTFLNDQKFKIKDDVTL